MVVDEDAGTPMTNLPGRDGEIVDLRPIAPIQLRHALEAQIVDQVARVGGGDHRHGLGQPRQSWAIEVVVVCVRDQDQVELGQLTQSQPRGDEPRRPAGEEPHAQAHASAEHRVSQDGLAANAQERCRVANPQRGERTAIPPGEIRPPPR